MSLKTARLWSRVLRHVRPRRSSQLQAVKTCISLRRSSTFSAQPRTLLTCEELRCRWQTRRLCTGQTVVRAAGPWKTLPVAQRQAWEVLGWTEESWDGARHPPLSNLKHWDELSTSERAAAQYGLGFTEASWDEKLTSEEPTDFQMVSSQSTSAPSERRDATSGEESSFTSSLIQAGRKALPWLKGIVNSNKQLSKSPLGAAVGAAVTALGVLDERFLVPVEGVEDVVFLDDSGSMRGMLLDRAMEFWHKLAQTLQSTPTRIVKFGSMKDVLIARAETFSSTSITLSWNATSGSTYMWHMILEDVRQSYVPGPGLLRVFVITDGFDSDSPPPYNGINGMDAMMKDLRGDGFNIQFHIIFVSSPVDQMVQAALGQKTNLSRYRDLAEATGGHFLHLQSSLSESPEMFSEEEFLSRVQRGDNENLRLEAKQAYEQRLLSGKATKFDWYTKLPK